MDERGLDVAELTGVVAALAEVWVLVYGAGDEAGDFGDGFGVGAEDEGEGSCEGGRGLHGGEGEFGDVVAGGGQLVTIACRMGMDNARRGKIPDITCHQSRRCL